MLYPRIAFQTGLVLVFMGCLWGCQSQRDRPLPAIESSSPSRATRPTSLSTAMPRSNPTISAAGERYYQQGVSYAASARSIAASAVSSDDWRLVKLQWQRAIQFLHLIPDSHPRYRAALSLISDYEHELRSPSSSAAPELETGSLTSAQPTDSIEVLQGQAPGTTLTFTSAASEEPLSFRVKVKRWIGNRPVIDVTFNQAFQFEMLVEPTASATEITATSAQLLGLPITQQVVKPRADQTRLAEQGRVASIQLGAVTVSNLWVTVGEENLQLGVLGQDVLNNFNVANEQNNVQLTIASKNK